MAILNYLKYALIGLLLPASALAGLPPTTTTGQSETSKVTTFFTQVPNNQATTTSSSTRLIETGNGQLLLNPSFEGATYSTSWTTANSTATKETTIVLAGAGLNASKHALSSQTGDLLSQSVTPTGKSTGTNYEATCSVNTTLTTIQLCSMVAGVEVSCVTVPSTGNYATVTANMPGSDGSSLGVKVKATSSSTGNVYVDDCYVGKARNIGTVQQAQDFGKAVYPVTANAYYIYNTSSYAAPSVNGTPPAPITSGNCTLSPSAASIKCASMGPGTYQFIVHGMMFSDSASQNSALSLFDGTTTFAETGGLTEGGNSAGGGSTIIGDITYTTPQSNVNFQIQGKRATSSSVYVDLRYIPLTFEIKYFPSTSQQVANAATTAASWNGYTNAGSGWTLTSSTYADFSTGGALTSGSYSSNNITCTNAASNLPGITCAFPKAGLYSVCAQAQVANSVANGQGSIRLTDGSNNILHPGITGTSSGAGVAIPLEVCGQVNAVAGSNTFKVQGAVGSSGTLSFSSAFTGVSGLVWKILDISQGLPAAIIVGSNTSNGVNAKRTEYVSVSSNGSCTLSFFPGDPTWISSSHTAAGECTFTFSGTPGSTPKILANGTGGSNTNVSCSSVTSSGMVCSTRAVNSSGALGDAAFDLQATWVR